jgi:transposase
MDMWEPYVQSTRAHLPGAAGKIVFDKFHVVKHLHDAVDLVRRGEHRVLRRAGDERLTGSKYLWLRRPETMTEEQRTAFRALQRQDLKVGRA